MGFDINNLWVVTMGGVDIWITRTIVNTWIIMLAVTLFALVVRIRLNRFEDVPKGFQNMVEALVEIFDSFVRNSGGERLMPMGTWFFTVFMFVLLSNVSGLVGMRPPTADWPWLSPCLWLPSYWSSMPVSATVGASI